MVKTHLEITWESYRNQICQGFTQLQHNEEFVDMTLAADGCLVKVHRNILALASPYIKAMLKSVDCQHPVIFLNNISYDILTYILEYVYTGKVHMPQDSLSPFVQACKSLKIDGPEDTSLYLSLQPQNVDLNTSNTVPENTTLPEVTEEPPQCAPNFAALITINDKNSLEIQKCTNSDKKNDGNEEGFLEEMETDFVQSVNYDDIYNTPVTKPETAEPKIVESEPNKTSSDVGFKLRDIELKPIYTISNRGALQLILNRFMYLCHHQSDRGFKRRWRCVDYRKAHCQAFVDTEGEIVTSRKGIHNHAFHDDKILRKSKRNIVFKTISQAESKEEGELRAENNYSHLQ